MRKVIVGIILVITIAGFFSFFALPHLAGAQEFTAKAPLWQGLVPCGRNEGLNGETAVCTLCHLIVGFQRLIQYGLYIVIAFAFAGIFFAGIMYVISSGDEGMITKAKSFLSASLIGFAVVLGAWIIVNTTLWLIGSKYQDGFQAESWSKFSCSAVSTSGTITPTKPALPQDNPNALNNRKQCLLYCARNYQVETDPFKGCWKLQCPRVDFGNFTPNDACLLDCYKVYSSNSSSMYNCLNLKCPGGLYNDDYKPGSSATETKCGSNNRGLCYPREGSVVLGGCPNGYSWLSGGLSCSNGYRCCLEESKGGEKCGPNDDGTCKAESISCTQSSASDMAIQCGDGLKCCKN